MSRRYRFESHWDLPLPPDRLLDVLADVEAYPAWWPQVRLVRRIDEDSAEVLARSFLPYSLRFVLTRAVEDREAGVLEARLTGRLDGWSRWRVRRARGHEEGVEVGPEAGVELGPEAGRESTSEGPVSHLCYEQEVTVAGPLLAAASRVCRPLLVANHAWMMRGGRRGLLRRGRSPVGGTPR